MNRLAASSSPCTTPNQWCSTPLAISGNRRRQIDREAPPDVKSPEMPNVLLGRSFWQAPDCEIRIRVRGAHLPADHRYPLFAAICRRLPDLHRADWLAIGTIQGQRLTSGDLICLGPESSIRIRLPQSHLNHILALLGTELVIARAEERYQLRVGSDFEFSRLEPHGSLKSDLVTIKLAAAADDARTLTRTQFLEAVRRQATELGIMSEPWIDATRDSVGNEVSRRVLMVRGYAVIGYRVQFRDLTDEELLMLLSRGLGGKRRMGCGWFDPIPRWRRGIA